MNASRREVKQYMEREVEDHVDWKTLEVNSTTLAEDACAHFNDYENDDIPEEYFDIAYLVAVAKEKELLRK